MKKDKLLVVYTMEGCQWCDKFKQMLKSKKIKFKERDIERNREEYDLFVENTQNDMVPAFMIVDIMSERASLFAPDRDYKDLDEAITIIKQNL